MHRVPSFRRVLAPFPLRWRLALVSLGLIELTARVAVTLHTWAGVVWDSLSPGN